MNLGSSMQHVLFSTRLHDGREICVSPISQDTFEANKAYPLGDDTGYFIYEYEADNPAAGLEILAKAISYEAAIRLIDIYVGAKIASTESLPKLQSYPTTTFDGSRIVKVPNASRARRSCFRGWMPQERHSR